LKPTGIAGQTVRVDTKNAVKVEGSQGCCWKVKDFHDHFTLELFEKIEAIVIIHAGVKVRRDVWLKEEEETWKRELKCGGWRPRDLNATGERDGREPTIKV
jgi:hypothetical protein